MSPMRRDEQTRPLAIADLDATRAVADVFGQSNALFFCIDGTGRIIHANEAFSKRLGYVPTEIESLTLFEFVAADRLADAASLLARFRAGEFVIGEATVFQARDGERFDVSGMFTPRIEHGELISALGMFKEQPAGAAAGSSPEAATIFDPGILETLVESSPDGAMIVDPELEIVAFNRNFLEIWGLDEAAVRDGNAAAVARKMIADPETYFAATDPYYADHELAGSGIVRLTDGRILDWHTAAAYQSDGEFLGRVWYFRDATERFEIAEELQRSGELYRQLATHYPNGAVFLYDLNLTFLLADGSSLSDFGVSRGKIEGRRLGEALPGRLSAELEPGFRAALAGRQTSRDLRFGPRTYTVTTVPIGSTSRDGSPQAMAILHDVSKQRRLEAQLRDAESRLRTLVEQIPAVTYVQQVGPSGNVTVYISPQVEAFFGYSPGELVNNRIDWVETIHPDDRQRVLAGTEASNAQGYPFSMEYRTLTKDGEIRWVRDEAAVIRDEHGTSQFWQGIIFDITDERKLEQAVQQSEERFRSAFDEAPMGIVMADLDGTPRRFNNAMCEMLGYSDRELLAIGSIGGITHPDDLERDVAELRRLQCGEVDRYRFLKRFIHRNGDTVWTQMDVSYVFNGERKPEYIIALVQDVSEQHRLQDELRQSEAVFRSAFDFAAIGMARVGLDGRWLDVNAALCSMLGYAREELVGRRFHSLTHPDDLEADVNYMRDSQGGASSTFHVEKRYIHRAGATIWASLSVSLVRSEEDGRALFYISQMQDITERKKLEERLEFQAHHDGLTGLLNRYGLMTLLEQSDGHEDDEIGVLVIDMDGFKDVNDRYGHGAGDEVLKQVAERISSCVRETDRVARLGGDEFVVALGEPVNRSIVDRLSKRIQEGVTRPIRLECGEIVEIGASIGTDIGPRKLAPTAVLRSADDAMYRAKRQRQLA